MHAIGQSLAIGPIFSAGLLTGIVAGLAGFNTPASVLLASVGMIGLAYVISLYARRYAGAGAMYEYVARGGHRGVGVYAAGIYSVGLLFLGGGTVFVAIGYFANSFVVTHLSIHIPWWIWGAFGLLVATAANHFGVRVAIRLVLTLCALSTIPFLILVVVIIAQGGVGGNTLSVFNPGQTSWNAVFNGILIAVTLFIGFEVAASLGEETQSPRKSIPIAVIGSVALAAIFYLAVTYAATIGFGKAGIAQWAALPDPMGTLASRYVGSGLATIIQLVIILDAVSVATAFTVAASRILLTLSSDGLLPKALQSTTSRDTPLGGNLVVVASGTAALIFGATTHYGVPLKVPNPVEAFSLLAQAGSYLIEAVYLVLAVFAFRFLMHDGNRRALIWRLPLLVAALATPVLAFKGSLDPWPTFPANRAVIYAAIWLGIAALWFGYLRVRYPERIATAAEHATEHGGVPPLDETLQFKPEPERTL